MAARLLKHYKDTLNDALDASNWTLVEIVGECFFLFPLFIFRSGVLRQGPDKFYSLGSQPILSLFVFS